MTDIKELEQTVLPRPLNDAQIAQILTSLLVDYQLIKEESECKEVGLLIEARYAREVVQMHVRGHCVGEIWVRITDDIVVAFRIRGLDVLCRIWHCKGEFKL